MLCVVLGLLVRGRAAGTSARARRTLPGHRPYDLYDVAVVGYLPEWRYEGANYDVIAAHVTHLLFFSLEVLPDGGIGATDRLPRDDILSEAHAAADRHGTELLICFGGNARSAGFSPMVRNEAARRRFVANVVALVERLGLHGVDYNWEYPGYEMGRGYLPQREIDADYAGLLALFRETRAAFDAQRRALTITAAYYPDGKQEALFNALGALEHVDLLHMMSYDQGGAHHSSLEFGRTSVAQGIAAFGAAGARQLTIGLPFYGRTRGTAEWTTYEDIVQEHAPLDAALDALGALSFNGARTIEAKTALAIAEGIGGVMIWEAGQDCRTVAVTRHGRTHGVTCPGGDESSLFVAITRAIARAGAQRARRAGWVAPAQRGAGDSEL
mgnify:FL=1